MRGGVGAQFHIHHLALYALVHGEKQWLFYPPGRVETLPRAVYEAAVAPHVAMPGSQAASLAGLPPASRPLSCRQRAGEVLLVPILWWHGTFNGGKAIGIGVQRVVDNAAEAFATFAPFYPRSQRAQISAHIVSLLKKKREMRQRGRGGGTNNANVGGNGKAVDERRLYDRLRRIVMLDPLDTEMVALEVFAQVLKGYGPYGDAHHHDKSAAGFRARALRLEGVVTDLDAMLNRMAAMKSVLPSKKELARRKTALADLLVKYGFVDSDLALGMLR